MGRVLAISSQVVRGHVGLSAIVPALQRLGHEVLAVPTVVLSNHPGHKRAAGTRVEVNTLASIFEVLDANGWLTSLDAVITGYMPAAEHVDCVATTIDLVRTRSPQTLVLVDPVLGDDPRGLYIEPSTADSIRRALVSRADIITPNRFELSWLADCDVRAVADVRTAAAKLRAPSGRLHVLATSVPMPVGRIANVSASGDSLAQCVVEHVAKVPHGTGDLLTGLYVGHRVAGATHTASLAAGVGGVRRAIANSLGRNDLDLTVPSAVADWAAAEPAVVEALS